MTLMCFAYTNEIPKSVEDRKLSFNALDSSTMRDQTV